MLRKPFGVDAQLLYGRGFPVSRAEHGPDVVEIVARATVRADEAPEIVGLDPESEGVGHEASLIEERTQ